MKKLVLASLCLAVGLARVPAMAADSAADATASAANRFWAEAEYLRWTVKGDKLPALVTTSPPGTPPAQRGVLGFPGTAVLFGDSTVNDGWRSGGRAEAGFWFDDRRTSGIETSFFQLGDAATNFRASSDGNSILARQFLDATTTRQDALLIASPGLLSGQITANETSHFLGAGLLYRREICACRVVDRISGFLGYRFLRATDRLGSRRPTISTVSISVWLANGTAATGDLNGSPEWHWERISATLESRASRRSTACPQRAASWRCRPTLVMFVRTTLPWCRTCQPRLATRSRPACESTRVTASCTGPTSSGPGGSSIRPSTQPSCPQGRSPDRAVRNPSSIAQTCGPTASISDWCSIFECLWKPVAPSMPLADFSPNCLSSADQRPERLPGDRQPTVHSTLADGSQFVGDLHSGPGVNPKKATSVAASISSGKAWLPPPQEGRSHRLLRSCEFWPLAGAGTIPASSAR